MPTLRPLRALRYTQAASPATLFAPPLAQQPAAALPDAMAKLQNDGLLHRDHVPGLYVYACALPGEEAARGLLCRVQLAPQDARALRWQPCAPDALFLSQLAQGDCYLAPICASYVDEARHSAARLDALCASGPRWDFVQAGCRHRFWIVQDPVAIDALCADFAKRQLCLAQRDAARYAAALRYQALCRARGVVSSGPDYAFFCLYPAQPGAQAEPSALPLAQGLAFCPVDQYGAEAH